MYQNTETTHKTARMAHRLRQLPHVDDATVLGVCVWLTCRVGAGRDVFRLIEESEFCIDMATDSVDGPGIKMNVKPEE